MRQPSAASAEIERADRPLPNPGKRPLLKVRVALAANAPFGGARMVLGDDWQHPVVLRRGLAISVPFADSPILPGKWRGVLGSRPGQKAIDAVAALVALLTPHTQKRPRGVLHQQVATFGTGELRQPHTRQNFFFITIRK